MVQGPRTTPHTWLLVVAWVVAACSLTPTVKARVSVANIESVFPVIEADRAQSYLRDASTGQGDCIFFEYRRGSFSSEPADDTCVVIHDPAVTPNVEPFDAGATRDLSALLSAFHTAGLPLQSMYVNLESGGRIGTESAFSFDRCVTYYYAPGWSTLPHDDAHSRSVGVSADWYKTDFCT